MLENFDTERIRRAVGRRSPQVDRATVEAQLDRVQDELAELTDMLGGAARRRWLSRAEAMRARAADRMYETAGRANETVREHPIAGLSGLGVLIGIGLLAALLSRK